LDWTLTQGKEQEELETKLWASGLWIQWVMATVMKAVIAKVAMDGTEIESTYSILWGPLDSVKP